MNEIARAVVIAALILGGAVVVRGMFGTDRYDLIPAVGGTVYRLDRLTGAVSICTPVACKPLPTLVPNRVESEPIVPAPGPRESPAPETPAT